MKKNILICDCLEFLIKRDLTSFDTILTSSPAVKKKFPCRVTVIDEEFSEENFSKFQRSISKTCSDTYVAAKAGFDHFESLIISRVILGFHHEIFKTACLRRFADYEDVNISIVRVSGESYCDEIVNTNWRMILDNVYSFDVIDYTYFCKSKEKTKNPWKLMSKFLKHLYLGSWTTLRVRCEKFLEMFKILSEVDRVCFIAKENELLIDVAFVASQRGYKLISLSRSPEDVATDANFSNLDFGEKLTEVFDDMLGRWVPSELSQNLKAYLEKKITESILIYRYKLDFWRNEFGTMFAASRERILLMNAPTGLEEVAMVKAAREVGIIIFSGQHGVTAEICEWSDETNAICDSSVANYVLCFNKSYSALEFSPYRIGQHICVGMSSRHIRARGLSRICLWRNRRAPILYISTSLFRGNYGYFVRSKTDWGLHCAESLMISRVLDCLPYKVDYKLYPEVTKRFVDEDPILEEISSASNVRALKDSDDLRYELSGYSVLITTSATSTLGWALISDKPLVLINWSNKSPIQSSALPYFESGLFLFHENEDLFEELKVFLSQPIEDIEIMWSQKMQARKQLRERFFSAYSDPPYRRIDEVFNKLGI